MNAKTIVGASILISKNLSLGERAYSSAINKDNTFIKPKKRGAKKI
jgi:hypothetical protein